MRQVPSWGQTTSYAAGTYSWSGLSTLVDPGTDIFVPEDNVAAEYANFAIKGAALDGVHAAQHEAVARPWTRKTWAKTTKDVCEAPGGYAWLTVVDDAGTYNIMQMQNAARAESLTSWRDNIGGNAPHKIWQFKDGVVVFGSGGTFKRVTASGITTPAPVAGSTWDSIGSWEGPGTANAVAVAHAGGTAYLFKSSDNGATWASTTVPASLSSISAGYNGPAWSGTCVLFAPKIAAASYDVLRVTGTSGGFTAATAVTVNASGHVYDVVYDEINTRFIAFSDDSGGGNDTAIAVSGDNGASFSATVATIPGFTLRQAVCKNGVIVAVGSPRYFYNSDTSSTPLVVLYALVEDLTTWHVAAADPVDGGAAVQLLADPREVIAFSDAECWAAGATGQRVWTGLSVP